MKLIILALLALSYSTSTWAIAAVPDSGSSLVLLAVAAAGLSVVRSAFRR